jgi:hypothetical protein
VIDDDTVLIAQHLRDEPITFTPTPPIAYKFRERFQPALKGLTTERRRNLVHPSI